MKTLLKIAGLLSTTTPAMAEAPVTPKASVAPADMQAVTPALAAYTDDVLFGENWEDNALSKRDRSLVTVASLVSGGKAAQLSGHLGRALDNGVKPSELSGLLTHLAFYSGWPNAVSATGILRELFARRSIGTDQIPGPSMPPLPLDAAAEAARAASVMENVAPAAPNLARYTNDVLFADLWRRPDLSPRDRSLVTIAALTTTGEAEQLPFHIQRGLDNGLQQAALFEALTHLAFYAGWPKAMSAVAVARKTIASAQDAAAAPKGLVVARHGAEPVRDGATANFVGKVQVAAPFSAPAPARAGGATVTFQPGARTAWHSHPLGQTLIVTDGTGWAQREGEPVVEMRKGDVVVIPPGARHWHGASPTNGMTHVAIAEALDGKVVDWFEQVSDADYRKGPPRERQN